MCSKTTWGFPADYEQLAGFEDLAPLELKGYAEF